MLNKRENINYSLFESPKVDKYSREEDGKKVKTKICCDCPTYQVQSDCLKLELSSQHQGY